MTGIVILLIVVVSCILALWLLVMLFRFISSHPDDCTCEECEAYRDHEREQ